MAPPAPRPRPARFPDRALAWRAALIVLATSVGAGACGSAPEAPTAAPSTAPSDAGQRPTPAPPAVSAPSTAPSAPPPSPGLGPPYPIVLMHGMAGFDELTIGRIGVEYWAGVREELARVGEDQVFVTEVTPYQTSEVRAREAAAQIDKILATTGKRQVALVGHSQGGLDARVLASPAGLDYGAKIASITTVATPHRGSYIADVVMKLASAAPDTFDNATRVILRLLQRTAYDLQGDPALRAQLEQISEKYMRERFNPKYKDAPGVLYESYAGRSNLRAGLGVCDDGIYPNEPAKVDPAQSFLLPSAIILEQGLPPKVNDGLVTVESAKWGTFMMCVPADHMKEVGQLNINGTNLQTFDHKRFYRELVARLRARGF